MTQTQDRSGAVWHKSTYSGRDGECVEVADNLTGVVLVRDTKANGAGPVLGFQPGTWTGFLAGAKAGEFTG